MFINVIHLLFAPRTNIFLVTKKRQSSKSQYYNDYKIRKFNLVVKMHRKKNKPNYFLLDNNHLILTHTKRWRQIEYLALERYDDLPASLCLL